MDFISLIKTIFTKKAPKVSCPKCLNLHDINSECCCPNCGIKYKLPERYSDYLKKLQNNSVTTANDNTPPCETDERDDILRKVNENQKKESNKRIVKLGLIVATISLFFLVFMLVFFKDKDALVFKTGEVKNQPYFYTTEDGTLNCFFPNYKGCSIGVGNISSYISDTDGKCVYITYTGAFGSSEQSNYVLRISNHGKKVDKITECKEYLPRIASGGDNKHLYIMTPKDDAESIFDLSVSTDGKEPKIIAENACELAVSTSGRYALVSVSDSGATKLMVYSIERNTLDNPGIKNAHPLSIDNKGEYMIYARKSTANSTDIVVEKNTTNRVEIPIFKDSSLNRIVFSQDRRSFAAVYSDKTIFYTCTDKDYTIATTCDTSLFGFDFNQNVLYNIYSFREIPQIDNVYGRDLLPYYYYDKEHRFVYRITESGAKETVFDSLMVDNLKVSENNCVAFVSNGILYTGKLDKNNNICRIMDFGGKELIDITPDGKLVYYKDSDGNMFTTEYGKECTDPKKITVDPDIVKYSEKGANLLVVSDGTVTLINKKGKGKKLCDNIDVELSAVAEKDLSKIFFVTTTINPDTGSETKSLYLYAKGKSKLITDELSDAYIAKNDVRLDRTKSDLTDISVEVAD